MLGKITKILVTRTLLFSLTIRQLNTKSVELPWLLLQLACLDDHTEEVYPENRWPACQKPLNNQWQL